MTEFDKALINVMQSLSDEDADNYAYVEGYIKEKDKILEISNYFNIAKN